MPGRRPPRGPHRPHDPYADAEANVLREVKDRIGVEVDHDYVRGFETAESLLGYHKLLRDRQPAGKSLNIDFVNETMGPSARVAVELSPESARALVQAILTALETGETEHGLRVDVAVPVIV